MHLHREDLKRAFACNVLPALLSPLGSLYALNILREA
jgi:hypothetical protein